MKRPRHLPTSWLLDPHDDAVLRTIQTVLGEIAALGGRPFRELHDAIEEMNRNEQREAVRKLRVELAAYLASAVEIDLPFDLTPAELRQFVFSTVWNHQCGFVTSEAGLFQLNASDVFRDAARHFNLSPQDVERYLYADTPEEKIVTLPFSPAATELPQIAATLNINRTKKKLRKAIRLRLSLPQLILHDSPYCAILWSLKRNQLMYDVTSDGNRIHINVAGPYALFEKTTIYGNRLADFVQTVLVKSPADIRWQMEVELISARSGRPAQDSFELLVLDNSLQRFFPAPADRTTGDVYKSGDEEAFSKYFARSGSSWKLHYEATLLSLRRPDGTPAGFMIPDFVVKHPSGAKEVLVEIVGFWRAEYLRRKVEKAKLLSERGAFFFVRTDLGPRREGIEDALLEAPTVRVLFYSNRTELKECVKRFAQRLD